MQRVEVCNVTDFASRPTGVNPFANVPVDRLGPFIVALWNG